MGYNISLTDHALTIERDKVKTALNAITDNDWVDLSYPIARAKLIEIFEDHYFEIDTDDPDDGIRVEGWGGEKAGDEDELLRSLAPYVTAGSYLEWEGEDSQRWRLDFDGTGVTEVIGHTAFHPRIDYDTLRDTVRDGLNADSGDAEREALAEAGQMLGLTMNDDGQYQ